MQKDMMVMRVVMVIDDSGDSGGAITTSCQYPKLLPLNLDSPFIIWKTRCVLDIPS